MIAFVQKDKTNNSSLLCTKCIYVLWASRRKNILTKNGDPNTTKYMGSKPRRLGLHRKQVNLPPTYNYRMHNRSLAKEKSPTSICPTQKITELIQEDFIQETKKHIFEDNLVSFLPNFPIKAKRHCHPQFAHLLPKREPIPSLKHISNQQSANPHWPRDREKTHLHHPSFQENLN